MERSVAAAGGAGDSAASAGDRRCHAGVGRLEAAPTGLLGYVEQGADGGIYGMSYGLWMLARTELLLDGADDAEERALKALEIADGPLLGWARGAKLRTRGLDNICRVAHLRRRPVIRWPVGANWWRRRAGSGSSFRSTRRLRRAEHCPRLAQEFVPVDANGASGGTNFPHGAPGARVILTSLAAVAQLARASACHAEGRGFESLQPLIEPKPAAVSFGASVVAPDADHALTRVWREERSCS
jgi:hypothetical protein